MLPQVGKGHPQVMGQVEHQLPKPAGIQQAGHVAGPHPGIQRQDLRRRDQAVEIIDPQNPIPVAQRLEDRVVPGHRAGMGQREPGAGCGPPDLEHDNRDVAPRRLFQCRDETLWVTNGLGEQRHDPGRGLVQRIIHVVGNRARQLLPRCGHQVEPIARCRIGKHREDRTGMAEKRDMSRHRRNRFLKTDEGAGVEVVKPHAVAAAERNPRLARHCAQAFGQQWCAVALDLAEVEDHGTSGASHDGLAEGRLHPGRGDGKHGKIGRGEQFRHAANYAHATDLRQAGIHHHGVTLEAADPQRAHHQIADRSRLRRPPD